MAPPRGVVRVTQTPSIKKFSRENNMSETLPSALMPVTLSLSQMVMVNEIGQLSEGVTLDWKTSLVFRPAIAIISDPA
jgi:hypothetical protein